MLLANLGAALKCDSSRKKPCRMLAGMALAALKTSTGTDCKCNSAPNERISPASTLPARHRGHHGPGRTRRREGRAAGVSSSVEELPARLTFQQNIFYPDRVSGQILGTAVPDEVWQACHTGACQSEHWSEALHTHHDKNPSAAPCNPGQLQQVSLLDYVLDMLTLQHPHPA